MLEDIDISNETSHGITFAEDVHLILKSINGLIIQLNNTMRTVNELHSNALIKLNDSKIEFR